ncbi:hypothetical protein GCM10022225_12940 [Plantactinospora mayteni]|uniref:Uncharacterized protein n=1 Tax=Plantactinospora mayteni TaxID=566021 RepID=A0ABQ4EGU3_9ACTN|nr:hypothetical protein [Plantactinospora mayteni]GIG93953.1 hypothetical protein Pma05_05260 [Plantactinospora mayteni]
MPPHKRVLSTLTASLLAGALMACTSPDDGNDERGADPGTGQSGPDAEFRDRNLLVTAVCSAGADGGWQVSVDGWDPKTWTHEAKAIFTVPATVVATEQQTEAYPAPEARSGLTALCTPSDYGPLGRSARDGEDDTAIVRMVRSLFDRDFTRLAVVIRDQDSGAGHVGYVDRGGQLTNLTATDIDFGSTPNEQYAVLSPDGAEVWFTYRVTDGDTRIGSRSVAGDHKRTERTAAEVPGRRPLFLVGDPVRGVVGYDVAVSPDGRRFSAWAPGVSGNGNGVFAVPAQSTGLTNSSARAGDNGCSGAVGWLDADTLLCPFGNGNLAALDVDGGTSTPSGPILPDNNRQNIAMVISPDGSQVVFLSAAETEREYWISATQPGSTPQRVEQGGAFSVLGDTAIFIEWR